MAAGTNTPGVIWVAGESAGKNNAGASASIPVDVSIGTGVAAPTASLNGSPFHLTAASGLFVWNGARWMGPV